MVMTDEIQSFIGSLTTLFIDVGFIVSTKIDEKTHDSFIINLSKKGQKELTEEQVAYIRGTFDAIVLLMKNKPYEVTADVGKGEFTISPNYY